MNRRLIIIFLVVLLLAIGAFLAFGVFNRNESSVAGGIKRLSRSAASQLFIQAKDLEVKGNVLEARQIYQKLAAQGPQVAELPLWQKKYEELNIKTLFSPLQTAKSAQYEVKSGDTLTKIAKEFNTTVELIRKSNNLSDDRIAPGKKLKVWTAPFSILVDKSQNLLWLKCEDEVFKTYIVSTGANNSTPIGTFHITEKIVSPTWFKAGAVVAPNSPDNALGSRWMGFNIPGYGIHGTVEPQSLGKQVTQGCVRLANPDVEELYIIVPRGTEVSIID